MGPDWTTKPCGSVLLFGSASMSALHTSDDVGLLSNQMASSSSTLMPFQCCSTYPYSVINNIIKTSLDTTGLHRILKPVGLDQGNGRRPDGVTSFPFKGGKALARDATCTDSFSPSNLYSTILNPGSASSPAEDLKKQKHSQLVADFELVPVAVETSGIIGSAGCSLLADIGRHILKAINDPRQMSYIFQQISVAII